MSRATFEMTSTKIATVRGPEVFSSLMYMRAMYEKFDTADRLAASARAWKQQNLSHRRQLPAEEAVRPAPKVSKPCQVISHTFSTGETWKRCLGIFPDGRPCAFAMGRSQDGFNVRRHKPEDVGAYAVDEHEQQEPEQGVLEVGQSPVVEAGDKTVIAVNDGGTEIEVLAEELDDDAEIDEDRRLECLLDAEEVSQA